MASIKIKATRRNRVFNRAPKARKKMATTLRSDVKPKLIDELKDNVSDWSHRVRFFGKITEGANFVRLFVHPGTKNLDIYTYVTKGTPRHDIPVSGMAFLAFTLGYSARTKPRGQAHVGSGTATGASVVGVMKVDHPGTKEREFEAVAMEDNETWILSTIDSAWESIIRSL